MMKRFTTLLALSLSLVLTFGAIPTQAATLSGDVAPSGDTTQKPHATASTRIAPTGIAPTVSTSAVSLDKIGDNLKAKEAKRIQEMTTKYNEATAKRQAREDAVMAIVNQYAPDLTADYTDAFTQHASLHQQLFDERVAHYTGSIDNTWLSLTELQAALAAQVKAGTLTFKEAAAQLKAFVQQERDAYKAAMTLYKTDVKQWQADYGNDPEALKALKASLDEAIKANDSEQAHGLLVSFLDAFQVHLNFDSYKLSLLKSLAQ